MRKLGKENWKLFVLLSILTVIIIIIFIFFIRYALSGDNSYQIDAGTVFFDENYIPVSFDTESELKTRFDGNYYLISDDSKEQHKIGKLAIGTSANDYAIDLYGSAYQVMTSGEVARVSKHTEIAKSSPPKFYKLADRKYLFVDQNIFTQNKEIEADGFLIIELDKQGNATLVNTEMSVKTINPIVLKGTVFDFDVVNEKLIYDGQEIDLKNIIGSTNEYKESEEDSTDKDKNDDGEDGNSSQGGSNNTLSYYDQYFKNVVNSFNNLANSVNSVNDNTKDTVKKNEIYYDFSRWVSLKKVTPSVTTINLDYQVFDPNSEYQSVFILVKPVNGDSTEKLQLNKNNTGYVLRNLTPDTEYVISFGFQMVGENEDVYTDTVTVKTRQPDYQLEITKVTRDRIYYTLKIDTNYSIESATVALYSDSSRIGEALVDFSTTTDGVSYEGNISYSSLGYMVEIRLENMIYNGSIINLDVSDKFINE